MSHHIPEPDWQVFRKLHKVALERYAEESLAMIAAIQATPGERPHETFLKLHELINERIKGVARLFDDFRRSSALTYLRLLRHEGLLTDSEILELSEETREFVECKF